MNAKLIKTIGWFFVGLTGLCCVAVLAVVVIILGNIILNGLPHLSWQFISENPSDGMTGGGIFSAIFGTVFLVFLMTIAVVPLGIATAVYLHEYAPQHSKRVQLVRLALQNLAGVPAIVFGLFGLGFFVQFTGGKIDQLLFSGKLTYAQPCILWASLTLAILTLPTVVIATEESLRSVPQSFREAAYTLGATRWQVIWRIVIPQSVSGILTGVILAISRGAGEVAPIIFTGTAYYLPYLPKKLNDQFMELGYHIYVMTTQSPDIEATKPILYATVLVLLLVTFSLNFSAIIIRAHIRKKQRLS